MLLNQTVIRLLSGPGVAGGKGGALKVDPANLEGFNRWLAECYNDHRALFAAGTVVALLVAGVAIGLLAEAILTRLGLGAKAIENHE
jgi:hypothetical protein